MRHTFKYIVALLALLSAGMILRAQDVTSQYHSAGGVSTGKTVTGPDANGQYTITLETFATGTSTLVEKAIPADIVLVLDVSGSMSESMYTYSARAEQGYSYNSYGNNTYYYLHTDGNYYAVSRTGNSNARRLRFQVGSTWWYLTGTTATTTQPAGVGNDTVIWTGVLYSRQSQTKIAALRTAVNAFIDEVQNNALYDSNGNERETPLDNQISIVKFANDQYYGSEASITAGNHRGAGSDSGATNAGSSYNYTEVLQGFTQTITTADVTSLKNAIASINVGGGTAAHYGMKKAQYLLASLPSDRESNKTVVLFTDGIPGMTGWDNTFANSTIANAYDVKNTYGATVFTVGVFANLGSNEANVNTYMNYTSSNYPTASSMTVSGEGSDQGFYQNASGSDLTAIFKSIAQSSGGSSETIGSQTQVRDVVSSSFTIPEGASADDITVYTMDIKSDASGWENRQTPEGVTPVLGTNDEGNSTLTVEGFDFSKEDTSDGSGDGNWVGIRYRSNGTSFYAGKKLVIEFKINVIGDATGGVGTATNTADSGVYIYSEETGEYTCINNYAVPHTTLPVNITIKKSGLRVGESATFEILRAAPRTDADGNTLYNAIGKPLPALNDAGEEDFSPWSKVVVTNTTDRDGATITKTLLALDPNWVYKILEDDWGWSYETTGVGGVHTTSTVEVNPFQFTNQERTQTADGHPVPKHAEAVTINHFATGIGGQASEEHYKSSKVESF